jgi:hypothetical protein
MVLYSENALDHRLLLSLLTITFGSWLQRCLFNLVNPADRATLHPSGTGRGVTPIEVVLNPQNRKLIGPSPLPADLRQSLKGAQPRPAWTRHPALLAATSIEFRICPTSLCRPGNPINIFMGNTFLYFL